MLRQRAAFKAGASKQSLDDGAARKLQRVSSSYSCACLKRVRTDSLTEGDGLVDAGSMVLVRI